MLRDEQKLCDIFQSIGEENVTVHLVCSQKNDISPTSVSSSQTSVPSQATPIEPSSPLPNNDATNNINFLNTNFNMANYYGTSGLMTPEQVIQQMAMMQQMYAQFVQYQAQAGVELNQLPSAFPMGNPAEYVPPAAPNAPPIGNNLQADQGAAPRVNEAAAVGDDEDVNRDWLDWFYWMSRAVVLFSIVYFYSSFSRFLVVVGLALIMYLYQIGWLFQRQERNGVANDANAPAGRNGNQDDANAQMIQQMMDGDRDRPRREDVPAETERFSGLRLFWVIVTSLFTSLIPEQIPANI